MENVNGDFFNECGSEKGGCQFQFTIKHGMECVPGGGDCKPVVILDAEESDFHDCNLVDATTEIKAILSKIPADPKGRSLSFINTNMGTLLAWVNHGGVHNGDAVTGKNDDATVAAALKLKL